MREIVKSTYNRGILKIQNVWFAESKEITSIVETANESKCDVLNIHGVRFDSNPSGWNEQYTIISDLTASEEELLKKMRKNFRYEIRRADKEGVVIKRYIDSEFANEKDLLDTFENTYNQMYRDKDMSTVFNRTQVEGYLRDKCMVVTVGFYENIPYVFHSYIYNSVSARFFYSTSPFRSDKEDAALIGRINKAVHWHDMKMFKNMGITEYDWGGISDKDASNGIDQFKVGFGGKIEKYYNNSIGVSLIGNLAVKVKKIRKEGC